jgi:serine protease
VVKTRIVAGAVVLASVTSACTQADLGAQRTPQDSPPAPAVSTEIVQFDDGLHRYVVTTTASPASGMLLPADAHDAGVAAASGLTGAIVVRSGAERQVVEFRAGDLEAVATTTDEQALVDEARRVGMIAFMVVDVTGAAGSAGARYVSIDGELELAGDAQLSVDAGTGTPRSDADVDVDVGAALRGLDAVVSAEVLAPGVIAVAASEPLPDLATIDGVVSAEPEVLFGVTGDPGQPTQWALTNTGDPTQAGGWPGTPGVDTGAPYAWDVAAGAGTVVAVIDSGIELDHPDLASQIAINVADSCGDGIDDDGNGFIDDCNGWDFGDRDNDPSPNPSAPHYAHGTHVAGIVAAARNGVGTVGIAPDALVLPVKVGRSDGAIAMSALVASIQYATDRGVDVINLSLSTGPGVSRSSVASLEAAIAYAGSRGVLVVAASGNNGVDITANSAWPASFSDLYPFVITAGAITNAGGRASFSNYGSPIDIVAPGWWIYAPWVGGGYTFQSGTSMAAPAVAGAAAVMLSHVDRPPAELRSALVATGVPSSSGPMLDVAAAVGQSRDGAWNVTYTGADALRADEAAGLSMHVGGRVEGAAGVRLHVATLDQGQVAAVGDLTAQVRVQGVASPITTDAAGAFPVFPLVGGIAAGETYNLEWLTLPAGSYALVSELVTVSGPRVGSLQVVYLVVTPSGSSMTTTVPPTTTVPAGGSVVVVATPVASPTTTAAPSTPTTLPTATTLPGSGPVSPATTVAGGTSGPATSTTTLVPPPGGRGGESGTAPTTAALTTDAPATAAPTTAVPGRRGECRWRRLGPGDHHPCARPRRSGPVGGDRYEPPGQSHRRRCHGHDRRNVPDVGPRVRVVRGSGSRAGRGVS